VLSVTDTSLSLKEKNVIFPVSTIGSIRTKHSAGNNILIGSVIGTTTLAIFRGCERMVMILIKPQVREPHSGLSLGYLLELQLEDY
jgi:hypothetical protein